MTLGPRENRYHQSCSILNEPCRMIIFIPAREQRWDLQCVSWKTIYPRIPTLNFLVSQDHKRVYWDLGGEREGAASYRSLRCHWYAHANHWCDMPAGPVTSPNFPWPFLRLLYHSAGCVFFRSPWRILFLRDSHTAKVEASLVFVGLMPSCRFQPHWLSPT